MPTTKIKNAVYNILLPFVSPGCDSNPITDIIGHSIHHIRSVNKLYRKYHVLGSATLLSSGDDSSLILTSSSYPSHCAHEDTFFRVASITKLATSILVLHLADQEILDIDAPVTTFFLSENLPDCFSVITLRSLLSHTSGLIDPPDLEKAVNSGIAFPDLINRQNNILTTGSFHYSNLGFGIIGSVLESIFNKPVSQIFDELLFQPLHMNATLEGCRLDIDKIMPVTRIFPYHPNQDLTLTPLGKMPLLAPDPLYHYGHTAGSMYTDIYSLFLLISILSGRKQDFLSERAVSEMKKQHASYGRISPSLSYGLGLLRISDPYISDQTVYGHQGFAYGCADGAFWEENTGRIMITLNGGCSEARTGRLGTANRDFLHWAYRKELPEW